MSKYQKAHACRRYTKAATAAKNPKSIINSTNYVNETRTEEFKQQSGWGRGTR